MLLLVGLGNPEEKYQRNRHNVGYQIIDAIADHYGFEPERKKFQGLIREGVIDGRGVRRKALLLKPTTYYNESGNSVREVAQFYKIPVDQIVVFHDELDLAPGKIKAKKGGSTAGNNGLKSITAHMGAEFIRIRVGIGHPGDKAKVTSHVLSDFSKSEINDWVTELKQACARNAPLLAQPENGVDRFMSAVALARQPDTEPATASSGKIDHTNLPDGQQNVKAPKKQEQKSSPFAKLKGLFSKD